MKRALLALPLTVACLADDPVPPRPDGGGGGNASPMMSFFVSSAGNGAAGGAFGGIAGLDARCQTLADAAGAGARTWRAYASTSQVDARDRIGIGPWFNFAGEMIAASVDALHMAPPAMGRILTEDGAIVDNAEHDILTGSDPDGFYFLDLTCRDWTDGTAGSSAMVGHTDWSRADYVGTQSASWNSSHAAGCDQMTMRMLLGTGRLYCFAVGGAVPRDAGFAEDNGLPPEDSGALDDDAGVMGEDAAAGLDADDGDAGVLVDAGPGADGGGPRDAGAAACPAPGGPSNPSPLMSFFVTSVGNGTMGGNYGGLAGADERCRCLADAVGRGNLSWRAYLSTAPVTGLGGTLVHARDRIGGGPWYNHGGQLIASNNAALHATPPTTNLILDEYGQRPPGNDSDVMTGSAGDGTALTAFPGAPNTDPPNCANWTDSTNLSLSWNGQSDHDAPGMFGIEWSSDHSAPCDPMGQRDFSGSGRIYCFATNGGTAPDGGLAPDSGVGPADSGMGPTDTGGAQAIVLSATTLALTEGGQGMVTVRLAAQPASTVSVTVTSADPGAVTATPAALSFGPATFATPQAVTLGAVQDPDPNDERVEVSFGLGGTSAILVVTVTDDDAGTPDAGVRPDAGGGGGGMMSFFVTSTGNAGGGNYGGIAGMDAKCQSHAQAAGAGGRTWRAYASADNPLVDARDRIGTGPWFNQRGEMIASDVNALHTNPPVEARLLDEGGRVVPRNVHDIVTGTDVNGIGLFQLNCNDWTSGTDQFNHTVGHTDWDMYPPGSGSRQWVNSHGSGCSLATMRSLLGEGRLYCFAIN